MNSFDELLRATNHTLVLLAGGLLAAFFWFLLRLPHSTVAVVTCALLMTSVVYDIRGWNNRIEIILKMVFYTILIQFFGGVLSRQKILAPLVLFFLTWLVLGRLRNRPAACVSVIAGHLGASLTGGFYPSATLSVDLLFSGMAAIAAASVTDVIHLPCDYVPKYPGGYTLYESFKITVFVTIGFLVWNILELADGIWIILTAVFIYYASHGEGDLPGLCVNRILAVPVGVAAGIVFMLSFTWFNYQLIYLMPLFGGLGFFILYFFRNYFLFTVFFMAAFSIYADFALGAYANIHPMQLLGGKCLACAVGGLLVFFGELLFEERKKCSVT